MSSHQGTSRVVGCAGILVADTICGPLPEMPAEGSLVAVDDMPVKVGGCAANVAIDLVRQGTDVGLLGCLGDDAGADVVTKTLVEAGIDTSALIRKPGTPTSKTVILLIEGQDRRFIHTFGANAVMTAADLAPAWLEQLAVFYLGGLFALPGIKSAALVPVLEFCRSRGITTVLDVVISEDFNRTDDLRLLLPHTDYFLPNDDEAAIITGTREPTDQVAALADWGAGTVIITCGGDGSVAHRDGTTYRSAAHHFDVVDTSGCGDAFASGLIVGMLEDWDLPRMLQYASAIGASATQATGTTDGVWDRATAEAFARKHPLTQEPMER